MAEEGTVEEGDVPWKWQYRRCYNDIAMSRQIERNEAKPTAKGGDKLATWMRPSLATAGSSLTETEKHKTNTSGVNLHVFSMKMKISVKLIPIIGILRRRQERKRHMRKQQLHFLTADVWEEQFM